MTGKDKAKAMYEQGKKYKDIAEELDISASTIRSWRAREKWKRKKDNATKQENVATKINNVAKNVATKKLSKYNSTDDRWKRFCLQYLQSYNATQAYMQVYNCDYESAKVSGPRLLSNDRVKSLLDELKSQQANELYITSTDVIKQQMKIAYGNIGDYLEVFTVKQPRIDENGEPMVDEDGNPIIDRYNEFVAQDPSKVDWSIVKSAHKGRDGLVIELYDKQKALEFLAKRLPDADEARIAKAKADSLDTDNNERMNSIDNLLNKIEGVDDDE